MISLLRKVIILAITGGTAIHAQPRQLTTDKTGSVLYFSSALNLMSTAPLPYSKLFRWKEDSGIQLFASRPKELEIGLPPRFAGARTTFYKLDSPSISRDGSTLLFVGHQDCGCIDGLLGRSVQFNVQQTGGSQTYAMTTGIERLKDYIHVDLSRNGRFLAFNNSGIVDLKNRVLISCSSLSCSPGLSPLDRLGGEGWSVAAHQFITDEGGMIYADQKFRLAINRLGKVSTLPTSVKVMAPIVNSSGTVAVYESLFEDGKRRRLYSLDLPSGKETLLFADPMEEYFGTSASTTASTAFRDQEHIPIAEPMFSESIDDEGRNILALVRESAGLPRQWLFLIQPDGQFPRWLAYTPEGYREAVFSGDGKIIFAVTEWGRLLRIAVETEEVTELLPRTPWVTNVEPIAYKRSVSGAGMRGAANRITGGGFTTQTYVADSSPAPMELGGVRVIYAGQPMVMLSVTPSEIIFQIPWEFPKIITDPKDPSIWILNPSVQLIAPSDSPFVQPDLTANYPTPPVFEPEGALHEDGEIVSLYRPLKAGEIIQVYATGFDSPKGETGVAADVPDSATAPNVSCTFFGDTRVPAELLYSGLTKARAGLYKLLIRVPAEAKSSYSYTALTCQDQTTDSITQMYLPFEP